MKGVMNNNYTIRTLSENYRKHKRFLKEKESGINVHSKEELDNSNYIVKHTEMVVNSLRERDRFIIYNEVILGKQGDWYRDCLSPATYYRHRKGAYERFLRCLNE